MSLFFRYSLKYYQSMNSVFDKLLYTEKGQTISSCIIGFGLAFLFKRVCSDNCTVYKAPYIEEIESKKFKLEDSCYTYTPHIVDCDNNKTILATYDIQESPVNKISSNIKSFINHN